MDLVGAEKTAGKDGPEVSWHVDVQDATERTECIIISKPLAMVLETGVDTTINSAITEFTRPDIIDEKTRRSMSYCNATTGLRPSGHVNWGGICTHLNRADVNVANFEKDVTARELIDIIELNADGVTSGAAVDPKEWKLDEGLHELHAALSLRRIESAQESVLIKIEPEASKFDAKNWRGRVLIGSNEGAQVIGEALVQLAKSPWGPLKNFRVDELDHGVRIRLIKEGTTSAYWSSKAGLTEVKSIFVYGLDEDELKIGQAQSVLRNILASDEVCIKQGDGGVYHMNEYRRMVARVTIEMPITRVKEIRYTVR